MVIKLPCEVHATLGYRYPVGMGKAQVFGNGDQSSKAGGRYQDPGERSSALGGIPSEEALGSSDATMPQSPHRYQSSPSISAGCWVRPEPLPHCSESTEQYLSHPQHVRSGCLGCKGNFFAICGDLKNPGLALIGGVGAMNSYGLSASS